MNKLMTNILSVGFHEPMRVVSLLITVSLYCLRGCSRHTPMSSDQLMVRTERGNNQETKNKSGHERKFLETRKFVIL